MDGRQRRNLTETFKREAVYRVGVSGLSAAGRLGSWVHTRRRCDASRSTLKYRSFIWSRNISMAVVRFRDFRHARHILDGADPALSDKTDGRRDGGA